MEKHLEQLMEMYLVILKGLSSVLLSDDLMVMQTVLMMEMGLAQLTATS